MFTSFHYLDLAFIVFSLIFVITAFLRGFVKEIFSLLNWVVSLTLSYLLAPYISKLFESYSDSKLVIDISARIIIFVLTFIIFAISTSGLSKALKDKMPKAFDRSLGVFYGLIKTLLIFGLFYSITLNLYGYLLGKKTTEIPSWMKEAKCYNILRVSGEVLDPLVKEFFEAITRNFDHVVPESKELDQKIDDVMKQKDKIDDGLDPMKEEGKKAVENNSGYNKKDIEKMNRLIEIIDK